MAVNFSPCDFFFFFLTKKRYGKQWILWPTGDVERNEGFGWRDATSKSDFIDLFHILDRIFLIRRTSAKSASFQAAELRENEKHIFGSREPCIFLLSMGKFLTLCRMPWCFCESCYMDASLSPILVTVHIWGLASLIVGAALTMQDASPPPWPVPTTCRYPTRYLQSLSKISRGKLSWVGVKYMHILTFTHIRLFEVKLGFWFKLHGFFFFF